MKLFLALFMCLGFSTVFSQKFEGKISFNVEYPEMMLSSIPPQLRDSVQTVTKVIKNKKVRTETWTKMGKQIMLEEIGNDTTYLLMTLMGQDLALEMVIPNSEPEKKDSLVLKGKAGKIHGKKCKEATYTKHGKEHMVIYTDDISPKYSNSFTELSGFALIFPVVVNERDVLNYKCTEINSTEVSDTYFDIPSKYKVVTMEEFSKMIGG